MAPLLEVDDLRVHFTTPDGVVKAVDGLSFTIERGRTLAIVGESGSGKSVTALSIMQLIPDPPGKTRGDIRFKGESLLALSEKDRQSIRGDRIAMIFQDPAASLNPVVRIGRQIAEPLRVHKGLSRRQAWARAVDLLGEVGFGRPGERAREYPHELSGGMQQRAMVAMALACGPDLLVADEATTALDVTMQAEILDLMMEVQARAESALIMITHDLGVAAETADHVLVMYAGRAVEYGTVRQVFHSPAHPYTWSLLQSNLRHDVEKTTGLLPIKGLPPSLIDLPPGCPFEPRCPHGREICASARPSLHEIEEGHLSACHISGRPGFAGRSEHNGNGEQ